MCPFRPFPNALAARFLPQVEDGSCEPEKLGGPRRNSTKRLGSGIGCGTKSRRSCADLPEKNCITWLSKGKSHLVKFVQEGGWFAFPVRTLPLSQWPENGGWSHLHRANRWPGTPNHK